MWTKLFKDEEKSLWRRDRDSDHDTSLSMYRRETRKVPGVG
jgi:hypothetical protein